MAGALFEVVFDAGPVRAALDRLADTAALQGPLLRVLGDYGRDSTRRRWMTQTAPDGQPWAPLSEAYAALKPAGYGILYLSGTLEGSITYEAGASQVSWGSPVVYAAVHQFGATIKAKNAKALYFKLGLGGVREVIVQSVTIPARPYLGISAEDAIEIPLLAEDYLARVFSGR